MSGFQDKFSLLFCVCVCVCVCVCLCVGVWCKSSLIHLICDISNFDISLNFILLSMCLCTIITF